jgi:hypothetical protein
MFRDWWMYEDAVQEYHRRRAGELEKLRLTQQLRASQPKRLRLHQRALARVGSWMVTLGQGLQRRYGVEAKVP